MLIIGLLAVAAVWVTVVAAVICMCIVAARADRNERPSVRIRARRTASAPLFVPQS
jgi:hypothetical protein